MKAEAIVPAAGSSIRMGAGVTKPLLKIGGEPIICRTLRKLALSGSVGRIIVAVRPGQIGSFRRVINKLRVGKEVEVISGGASRMDSVRNCLSALGGSGKIVLVHDAVRPFVEPALIDKLVAKAERSGAAIAAVPVKPTIKVVNSDFEVCATLERKNLWEIQTPQVFRKELLLRAYQRFGNEPATDDASLVEKLGVKVSVVFGSYLNIKITTPEDLALAEAILSLQKK